MPRSRHVVPLAIIAVVVGGLTAGTFVVFDWIPEQASKQAERVDPLMWFVVIASGVIFTIVITFLVYSAFRFRVAPDDDSDGPPIHGNTRLEIAWTLVPTMLLIAMAIWAYIVLSKNEALADDRLKVDVIGQQFAWTFTYPAEGIETGDLRLPVGRQVELRMTAVDVIHDLYVPEFRVKQDVVPGIKTTLIVNPTKTGTFPIICAELCGLGHNTMRAQVMVMEPAAYDAWVRTSRQRIASQAARPAQPS